MSDPSSLPEAQKSLRKKSSQLLRALWCVPKKKTPGIFSHDNDSDEVAPRRVLIPEVIVERELEVLEAGAELTRRRVNDAIESMCTPSEIDGPASTMAIEAAAATLGADDSHILDQRDIAPTTLLDTDEILHYRSLRNALDLFTERIELLATVFVQKPPNGKPWPSPELRPGSTYRRSLPPGLPQPLICIMIADHLRDRVVHFLEKVVEPRVGTFSEGTKWRIWHGNGAHGERETAADVTMRLYVIMLLGLIRQETINANLSANEQPKYLRKVERLSGRGIAYDCKIEARKWVLVMIAAWTDEATTATEAISRGEEALFGSLVF